MQHGVPGGLAVELPGEQYAVLLENLPLLEEFGFAAEDFGAGCLGAGSGGTWGVRAGRAESRKVRRRPSSALEERDGPGVRGLSREGAACSRKVLASMV